MTHSKTFTIQAKSEGCIEINNKVVTYGSASITMNGIEVLPIPIKGDGTGKTRGLHVAVINEQDGSVVQKEHFKTYDSSEEASRFAKLIEEIPIGRIVALAICDEASRYITGDHGTENQAAINACQKLGSKKIEQLKYRDSYVLIGHKGFLGSQTVECLRKGLPASGDFQKKYFLEIQAKSEGKRERGVVTNGSASIIVNGMEALPIPIKGDGTGKTRGLHVAVINEQDGSVVQKEHFKTHDSSEEASRFAKLIEEIPIGRIVALAICDEGAAFITGVNGGKKNQDAIDACKKLGSTKIQELKWRDSYVLIGHKDVLQSQTVELLNTDSQAYVEFKKRNPIEIKVISEGKRESGVVTNGRASITVNGEAVINVSTENNRGLHVAVISEQDGSVVKTERFKTYDKFEEASRFAKFIQDVSVGRLVAIAVCDEGSKYITGTKSSDGKRNQEAIDACKSLGSTNIEQLQWRDSWVLIGQKGRVKTIEVREERNSSASASVSALISSRENLLKKIHNKQGISARISLTEDYQTGDLENRISFFYRAIISFPIGTTEAKLTAVQDIEVEIDGKKYTLNPATPVTVPTNALGKMVLIKKAAELNIPAIKVRTSEMRADESYIVCIDSPAYYKIADLEPDAIAKNRNELNIKSKFSDQKCNDVQNVITRLASAYQNTYHYVEGANGTCRDRYVRPHNMEDLHWKYSKESGITNLTPQQAHEETKSAKLKSLDWKPGQSLFEDIGKAFISAQEIVVHTVTSRAVTAYKLVENAVKTVEDVAVDTANIITKVAEDEYNGVVKIGNNLVHGNISGAVSDAIYMESAIISDVFTGGENITSHLVEGSKNAVVITFKSIVGDVQYILDHTGKLGEAIEGCLKEIELEAEHLLVWLAEELGWDDILKVQKAIERTFKDGMDKMPNIIKNLKTQIDAGFKTIKTDLHSNIQQAREYFGANSNLIAQGENDHATLDKAHEHTDWLMSKVTSDSDTSTSDNFAVPEPPQDLLDAMEGIIKTLSDKIGNDTILQKAIKNLEDDFRDLFQGSLLDAPKKMILIVLDLAEIIADVAIDLVNTIVDVLLDCFSSLIQWFQRLLNIPIKLPFITDIYKMLTKGEQLTILSFSSLMVAIPAKFIAEFFGDNLAKLTPSASKGLTSVQKWFGYLYAGCQFGNGILNCILDLPPSAVAQGANNIELQPVVNGQLQQPLSGNNNPPQQSNIMIGSLLTIDFLSQIFGSPSGDHYLWRIPDNKEEEAPFDIMVVIWAYQCLLFVVDFAFAINSERAEDSDNGLFIQFVLELFHLGLFLFYNEGDSKNHPDQKWNYINTALFLDPFEGLIQVGRTQLVMGWTEGGSYAVVPVSDIFFQSAYAFLYGKGISDQS
ncbi:hypothetical protein NG799_15840 [Laspinema sp. D1]|uniref:ILEI/PANDER domain-containing protein n=1 Tax=Laspinema palackyanum D2a TaxID=2953684 RepID=A0ABT2MSV1_9CYAN|nr:hypothetical protein [Laspinema sp. D2a]